MPENKLKYKINAFINIPWVGVFLMFILNTTLNVRAATSTYNEFHNIALNAGASIVNSFTQDDQGVMWLGTDKGLYSYNGYTVQAHLISTLPHASLLQTRINCSFLHEKRYLWLGSDNGIFIFDTFTDQYLNSPRTFPSDIRSLSKNGDELWIGSLNGLYKYHFKSKKLENLSLNKNSGIPHHAIYSILKSSQQELFVGTYNGLCVRNKATANFQTIALPTPSKRSNLLVNALLEDAKQACIWIGTEGYLFKYDIKTKLVVRIAAFDDNSVKSLAKDVQNNLLVGTDNGLYIYQHDSQELRHIVHDSRFANSLTNNIIWSLFIDRNNNSWIGTDYGVSMYEADKIYQEVSLWQLTGKGDGNQLQSIYRDSRSNFWLGGTNGAIVLENDFTNHQWYKMGDKANPISHNRIRDFYEDKQQNLWVATDGSINRYDYKRKQFIHYSITDSTFVRNANWAYSIMESADGRLWVASCLGGIFVVDKQQLLANATKNFIAEKNYYQQKGPSGLSDNFVSCIKTDLEGNVWALTFKNNLNKINPKTDSVKKISLPNGSAQISTSNASSLICDSDGYIWIGYVGGLYRIHPKTNRLEQIRFDEFQEHGVRLMIEENNRIWINTSNGTFVMDKKTLKIKSVNIPNREYTSIYYDETNEQIYLGGVDGYVYFPINTTERVRKSNQIILTSIYVNDRLLHQGVDKNGNNIRYADEIELNFNQNNITFEISDLNYSENHDGSYLYMLKGIDDVWRRSNKNNNRIAYNNLAPGTYVLLISNQNAQKQSSNKIKTITLTILPPWYASIWAKLVYALLIISLIVWVIIYFRERHRIRIERIEKEKSLELSKLKIDFFTNVSHDLKTPLSLIIAPVSKLLVETKNAQLKKQLSIIQQNALRLNGLIQQVIGFERMDDRNISNMIYSHVEFMEFSKGIFSVYENAFQTKGIQAVFTTNVDYLLVNIDVLKMESVLNNLISNALKFTNNGTIELNIAYSAYDEQNVTITIADTGIGIPKSDVGSVFDRYYQARTTMANQTGSGIGLFLVKQFVEMHNGSIAIRSEENAGTSFTLRLPVVLNANDMSDTNQSTMESTEINKPLILIVEDNLQVSDFIVQELQPLYRCITAHNGKSGLDASIQHKPDLIITDIMMPIMDGMEMCKQLRKTHALAHIPIIMLTAKDDKTTEEKSIDLGVSAFVSKPFDTTLLLLRIKQLLGVNEKMHEKVRLEVLATPSEIKAQSLDEKLLSNITSIIEANVADSEFNVNKLCELSDISNKQIYRRIKQLTGLSPVDYIRTIRMKKAAMLLAQNKFSVAEVMYLVGFSNYSYFSKCFQNQFGKTPKQFAESSK